MSDTRSTIQKINAWRLRVFPDRQVFLRSEGRVRFVTISSPVQMAAASALLASALWGVVTSVHFLMRDTVIEAKDQQILEISTNYRSLSNEFSKLESEIEKKATRLEQRQLYLEQLSGTLNPDTSANTSSVPDIAIEDIAPAAGGNTQDLPEPQDQPSDNAEEESFSFVDMFAPSAPQPPELDGRTRRNLLLDRLTHIDTQQRRVATTLLSVLDEKRQALDQRLAQINMTTQKLVSVRISPPAAEGGPYLPASDFQPVFAVGDDTVFKKLVETELALNHVHNSMTALPIGKPAESYYVSSRFGRRKDPIRTNVWANHPGLDLAGWSGTAILATAPGVVVKAQWHGAYGQMVEIDHGNGYRSRFGHMRKLRVKKGDIVEDGQRIGDMGKTGRATDTHLHYEIWFDGELQDPMPYVKADTDVFKVETTAAGR